jgi:anti-sigma regulatory factor (Ser/Thr protein kinase)
MIVGDVSRLRQILLNLISNAVKFTDDGVVTTSMRAASPGVLRFAVEDTGIGIQPDKLTKVFEDFEQVSSSSNRQRGGTGLGLGIAKRLVELMGGRIWVESEPGRGSRFQFTIRFERPPLLSEVGASAATATPQADGPAAAPQDAPRRRILLADDSEDSRTLIRYYLKKLPYDLDFAENGGRQALRRVPNRASTTSCSWICRCPFSMDTTPFAPCAASSESATAHRPRSWRSPPTRWTKAPSLSRRGLQCVRHQTGDPRAALEVMTAQFSA